jgi:hypothetical protein
MNKNLFGIVSLMYLSSNIFLFNGCSLNQGDVNSTQPAVTATLFLLSQKPQSQVLVRVPYYQVMSGQASILGREYYGKTILKSEATKIYRDLRNQSVQDLVGDDLSLCDIYYLVDRQEPELAADIYLRTTVSCEIIIGGFSGQLRNKATNSKHEPPFVFRPGTYHLNTVQYN